MPKTAIFSILLCLVVLANDFYTRILNKSNDIEAHNSQEQQVIGTLIPHSFQEKQNFYQHYNKFEMKQELEVADENKEEVDTENQLNLDGELMLKLHAVLMYDSKLFGLLSMQNKTENKMIKLSLNQSYLGVTLTKISMNEVILSYKNNTYKISMYQKQAKS